MRKYNRETKLEFKEYTYKCSEAVYKGQWRGGFREGKGIMSKQSS
jgi:hypothetical protein